MSAVKPGDEVYDLHGRAGEYVGRSASGHIVVMVYETDDGPYLGEPEAWPQVFLKPPTAKLEAAVAELDKQVREKRWELAAVESSLRDAERMAAETRKRIAQHPDLSDLDMMRCL